MKHTKIFGLLFISTVLWFSCKKSDDSPNPSEELKGSVWAGEFKLTSSTYPGLQPGSLILNADGSFTWYDLSGSFSGTWTVDANKVTIKFSSGTTVIADVAKDSWSNFSTTVNKSFQIVNLSRTTIPKSEELNGSNWKLSYLPATERMLNFMPGQNLTTSGFTVPYSVFGGGIKYSRAAAGIIAVSYCVFIDGTSLKGCDAASVSSITQYILFDGRKQ